MVNANNTVEITFDFGDSNVKEVQLIFKDTYSLTANIIENITKATALSNKFTFQNNKAYAALPEDQLTRLFDNVPLKAKAQEYIGNRLSYGNYTQFYDIADCNQVPLNISLKAELNSIPVVTKGVPRKTFKSDRDYEIGIVYLDDYGRMTTVLTSDKNTVHVPASLSTAQNLLKVQVKNYAPCFATKYRFFIKQNKSEYYNVFPVDYFQDGLYTWFLIPKADIDKVQ
jgi:hypothetical protein